MKKPLLKKKIKKDNTVNDKVLPKKVYKDLKEVMDYTRPLNIFYSGVEYENYLDILYDLGIRNFLMSFEYLKGKGSHLLKKYNDISLFIDSGAFTYMSDPKYNDYPIEFWENQIEDYLEWTLKNREYIFAIADLDLQYVVGAEKVYEWRKKYFEPFMLETGIPVCFIYHDEGDAQWEYMCKRYPYVGFSLATDDSSGSQLTEKFKIAEKYNSLVQGMASTRTSMLTQFPFYTVDSTTWNVGLKYGEISVWNSTKMSRIKKADFESKAFPSIEKYDLDFDFELIKKEDKTEMIRVNAYAFVQAEKYVQERLKSRMYWFRQKLQIIDIDNLPSDFFPPVEWFKGDCKNSADYCKKMNLNPDFNAVNMLYDVTAFLNWDNPEYVTMREWYSKDEQLPLLEALHDDYVNRIAPDFSTKVEDLINFFKECVSGKNDKLLHLGTNFDKTVKERTNYLEEEIEEDLIDLPEDEVKFRLQNLLPESTEVGAPEIDALDEEIFKKAEIVPTFDDKGKFLKGQVAVRKPKKVYSSKYPKFACDTCYAAVKCVEFKPGHVCAYQKMFTRFDTRNMQDIIEAMQGMVDHNLARMQRAMIMEVMMGVTDPQVTQFINQNTSLLGNLQRLYENSSQEIIKQTRVFKADGSAEETTHITNPQSGGILAKLFSDVMSSSKDGDMDIVEAEVVEEVKEKNDRYKEEED